MKIRTQFILAILTSILVPVLALSSLVFYQIREQAVEQFEQNSLSEIKQIDNTFSLYISGLAEDASYLATTGQVKIISSNVTSYMDSPAVEMTPLSNGDVEANVYRLFEEFGEARPDLAYVFLGTSEGGYIQWPGGKSIANLDPRVRPWYLAGQKALNGGVIKAPAYMDLNSGAPVLDLLTQFKGENGVSGVVGVDVSLNKLTEMLNEITFGQSGYIMLVEDTGVVLADPSDSERNFKQLSELEGDLATLSAASGLKEIYVDGQKWYANVYTSAELGWKFIGFVPQQEVFASADSLIYITTVIGVVLCILFILFGYWLAGRITNPINRITSELKNIATGEGDLSRRIDIEKNNEIGEMASAFNHFVSSINDLVKEIKQNADSVNKTSVQTNETSQKVKQISVLQSGSLEQVATAFNQMVATSNDVAESCNRTATAASEGLDHVESGREFIQSTSELVNVLESTVSESNHSMQKLAQESGRITSILDTIREIADQTNLLALNAAIEAARAGDHGRGFAVVADEVRSLAKRTAESTEEIDVMIRNLTEQTELVSGRLSESMQFSGKTVEMTEQTKSVFEAINQSVISIGDMTSQIATAAEEQHIVAEEINRNVESIHTEANKAREASVESENQSFRLEQLSTELAGVVGRFKTQ
ncbi:methyl-accepting chemotaxis protein [Vibrio sp. SCSIO 43137]|uniref:methyl-accepting chemotaxis protein n=1 Tax=Vibrio sp. SCSIO 43137 TaxID=3021011 RepID=UPI0023070E85|nr:methyl-accepting chemotaxis protein [Vibrio sp. SCSIO 43137]WCE28447.1 methyl-accepting chemotaxis protein [Vibrio sp. SCSIO 43137]